MSIFFKSLRLALRGLLRHPLSSLVLIVTLGLGIGLNSAVFSVANAVLFKPLPYPEPHEIVAVWESEKGLDRKIPIADGNVLDLHRETTAEDGVLAAFAAYSCGRNLVSVGGGTSFYVSTCAVTRDFFEVFGVAPGLGRTLAGDEDDESAPVVAVISHGFWQSAFGGEDEVLGRQVTIFGISVVVVGVMPPGFSFPRDGEIWVGYDRFLGTSRTAHNLQAVGRLAPGTSLTQARAKVSRIAAELAASYPDDLGSEFDVTVRTLHDDLAGPSRTTLLLLVAIVGVVLLIACANIAGVLLARALARSRELGIRQALGGGRGQIAAQYLVESSVLGALGTLAGLALAAASLSLVNSLVPASLLHSGAVTLDARVVVFSLVLGLLTGVLCGLAPVWRATRRMPLAALATSEMVVERAGRRRRLGGLFVVPQYAFSLLALIVAGLLVKSLANTLEIDPGFATESLVTAQVILPTRAPSRFADPEVRTQFYRQTVDEVARLSGMRSATLSLSLPFVGQQFNGVAVREGDPMPTADDTPFYPDYRVVGRGYFQTLGTPIVRGRDFDATDTAASEAVVVVNQTLARRMWDEENPLGKRLRLPGLDLSSDGDDGEAQRLLTVVGVSADVRHWALTRRPRTAAYVPWTQHLSRVRTMHVVAAGPAELVEPIRQRILEQDGEVALGNVRTIDEILRVSTSESRFRANLLAGFSALALLLALVGVYGVMSYTLSRRSREMAIRMAVGADLRKLRGLVLREGGVFVLSGQILGTLAVVGISGLVEGLLFGVETTDPGVFAVASLSLALVVLLTCWSSSRRIRRLDPSAMLKYE